MEDILNSLPPNVKMVLEDFVESAKTALNSNLSSIILYGSAAEAQLRPSSDVNIILILKEFQIPQINELREKLRIAFAAIRLNVMFLLEEEILAATEAFAVKFNDILSRHRVLYGKDFSAHLEISREAIQQRLKQVLLNLTLRLRERYALVSLRKEQLVPIIADVTGPIRAAAVSILGLEGIQNDSPKEALQILTHKLSEKDWDTILHNMSIAREEKELKADEAENTFIGLIALVQALYQYLQKI